MEVNARILRLQYFIALTTTLSMKTSMCYQGSVSQFVVDEKDYVFTPNLINWAVVLFFFLSSVSLSQEIIQTCYPKCLFAFNLWNIKLSE